MTQPVGPAGLTAEDLFLVSSTDGRQELNRGTLVRMPPAGGLHGRLAARVGRLLDEFVEFGGLGVVCGAETGFILARDPDIVRAPGLCSGSTSGRAGVQHRHCLQGLTQAASKAFFKRVQAWPPRFPPRELIKRETCTMMGKFIMHPVIPLTLPPG